MRILPRWALNNLISLFSLLLLVGCCQFFRGADDLVSFTITPLNMSIQPGNTQNFSATGSSGTSLSVVNQTVAIRSIAITPQTPKLTGDLTRHLSRQQPTRIAPTASPQTRLNGRQVVWSLGNCN